MDDDNTESRRFSVVNSPVLSGPAHQISYEIRITAPLLKEEDSGCFWGIEFSANVISKETNEEQRIAFNSENLMQYCSMKGKVIVKNKTALVEGFPQLKRVQVENRLVAINGFHIENVTLEDVYERLRQTSESATVSTPCRLLFHRHDYAGALLKIIPYATSEKVIQMQKQRRADKEAKDQSKTELMKQTAAVLDVDFNDEGHILSIIGDQQESLNNLVSQWQAYQYDSSTWYFNPEEPESLYAEHPVRIEARALVAGATLRCKIASRAINNAAKKYILTKRKTEDVSNRGINLVVELILLEYVECAANEVKEAREENQDTTVASTPDVEDSKEEPTSDVKLSVPAPSTPDVADSKEEPNDSSSDGKRSGYSTATDDEEEFDSKDEKEITVGRTANYWKQRSHRSKQILCSRKMIDLFIQRASRTIQRYFRGYWVRKTIVRRDISYAAIRPASWADVALVQRQNKVLQKQVVRVKKKIKESQGTMEDLRQDVQSSLKHIYEAEILKRDAEILKLQHEISNYKLKEKERLLIQEPRSQFFVPNPNFYPNVSNHPMRQQASTLQLSASAAHLPSNNHHWSNSQDRMHHDTELRLEHDLALINQTLRAKTKLPTLTHKPPRHAAQAAEKNWLDELQFSSHRKYKVN